MMILGLSLQTFTMLHVAISLIGILSGVVAVLAMVRDKWPWGWNAVFLINTIATSVTGFMFPFTNILPSHVFGVISLAVLAIALIALYSRGLAGIWRPAYIISVFIALYLNVFVGVAQGFLKLAFFRRLAPTSSEPPFLVAQLIVLAVFVALGILTVKRFRPLSTVLA